MAVSNLDKYVRGQPPALLESKDKYLENELRKLEKQATTAYDRFELTETNVNGLSAELTEERSARIENDEAISQRIETIIAVGARQNIFRQAATPTGAVAGDLWIDSDDGNKLYYYSGSAWVLTDNAQMAANAAAITSEATSRSDADSALATSISTVSATASRQRVFRQTSAPTSPAVSDLWIDTSDNNKMKYWSGTAWVLSDDLRIAVNAAAITTETTARADADSALATQITNLSASTTTSLTSLQANITSESTARTNADTALSTQISTVSATANGKNQVFRQDAAPTASATGDLWFDSDDNNKTYRWSGTAWVATDDARIATNAAAITTEASARATADSALSSQISTVSATANTKNRTFLQSSTPTASADGDLWINIADSNKLLRWNGTAWAAADDTRTASNAAAITTETTARVNGDSALASQITALSSTVGSNTTSITTAQSSIDGVKGRYGVTINNNGHVSGISLLSDSSNGNPSSVFRVAADQFAIRTPGASTDSIYWNSGTSKLIVRGDIEATSVTTNAVNTPSIVNNAVTVTSSAYTAGSLSFSGNSWATIQSLSYTASGAPVIIFVSFVPQASYPVSCRILVNDITIQNISANASVNPITFMLTTTPNAGTVTIKLEANTPFSIGTVAHRTIVALEAKR